jgi:hypothetical protein
MNPEARPKLLEWRPLRKNTLIGFAKLQFASGLIVSEIAVHVAGSRIWASPPSRPWLKDNVVVLDKAGKPRFSPVIDFATHGLRSSWSRLVLTALRETHPELFPDYDEPS